MVEREHAMREPGVSCTSEVDTMKNGRWQEAIETFEDLNIYQTDSYGAERYGEKNVSHLVVKRDNRVIAAAQCGIVKPPIIRSGVAHVRWGPLWKGKDGLADPENFRQAIRALRNEYTCRRGLLLRVYPNLFEDEAGNCAEILQEEGYSPWRIGERDRTLVIDLERSLQELRSGMSKRWRHHLNRAEQSALDLVEGSEDGLFEEFMPIYREMLDIKGIAESTDITRFRRAQKRLPAEWKMRVFLCRTGGKACAGIIGSAMGKIGITMFRATNAEGRKCEAAYLVHWRALQWLKEQGCKGYDMDGINPVTNPGTYQYKSGLCGRNGRDVQFLGQFENCEGEFTGAFVRTGERFLRSYRSARQGKVMKKVRASFAGVRGWR